MNISEVANDYTIGLIYFMFYGLIAGTFFGFLRYTILPILERR